MVVGTRSRSGLSEDEHLVIRGHPAHFEPKVKNLGVVLDASLSMSDHVSHVCRCCYLELRRIASIRHLISESTAIILVCYTILTRVDYCNSLLAGGRSYI